MWWNIISDWKHVDVDIPPPEEQVELSTCVESNYWASLFAYSTRDPFSLWLWKKQQLACSHPVPCFRGDGVVGGYNSKNIPLIVQHYLRRYSVWPTIDFLRLQYTWNCGLSVSGNVKWICMSITFVILVSMSSAQGIFIDSPPAAQCNYHKSAFATPFWPESGTPSTSLPVLPTISSIPSDQVHYFAYYLKPHTLSLCLHPESFE